MGLVLADVCGKGLPAALLTARLQATLLAFVPELPSLAALASKLHKAFRKRGLENRFATLVYLEVEPGSSRIRLVNAGHMPPLVVGADQRPAAARGRPCPRHPRAGDVRGAGARPGCGRDPRRVLGWRDEAVDEGDAFFGDERLLRSLRETAGRPAAEVAQHLLAALEAFVGEAGGTTTSR